jgi:EAL domain-containing protein (putative c-di-GMP-specific phosphodiesterase class I)
MTANDVAQDRERLQTRLVYWSRIAKQYDLLFVVKGVENQEEVDWLQEHQVTTYMQGYYFDRPVLPRVE